MTNIDKKALYESIMKNVAIEVKKYLNESATKSSIYDDTTWEEFISRQNTLEDLVCAFNGVYNIYDIDIDLFDSADMGFIWFEDNDNAQTLPGFIKEVKKYGDSPIEDLEFDDETGDMIFSCNGDDFFIPFVEPFFDTVQICKDIIDKYNMQDGDEWIGKADIDRYIKDTYAFMDAKTIKEIYKQMKYFVKKVHPTKSVLNNN
jgi:hypothetical protein